MSQVWAFALVLTVGIGFIVTTFLSGVAGGAGHLLNGAVAHVGAVLVSLVLNVGVFWLSFRIATLRKVRWRDLRTGAAIAAFFWQVLQVVGGYVVSHQLHRASELYGTFGIVLGLLAWLFLQAEVTLYAAEADVVLARRLWPGPYARQARPSPLAARQVRWSVNRAGAEPVSAPRPDDGSSLEEQPGRDGQADAGGQAPVPPPRGEPSASDKTQPSCARERR